MTPTKTYGKSPIQQMLHAMRDFHNIASGAGIHYTRERLLEIIPTLNAEALKHDGVIGDDAERHIDMMNIIAEALRTTNKPHVIFISSIKAALREDMPMSYHIKDLARSALALWEDMA